MALPTHPLDRTEKDDPKDMKLSNEVASSPLLKQDLNERADPNAENPNELTFDDA
jgi:hypothetical protein